MALPKGTKRYQHKVTGEIRYFKNPPNKEIWNKVGTPGSKLWKWINNGTDEKYISSTTVIPEGYSCGRIKK
ncbi:hypothetical protein SCRM01_028c [Synechococcus phage S-CRM01]|uniref:hypothetical protein n=1 Tax=Synechococcus phage S-CRM01 TaxID=1026955 RepID=UPI000209E346|nr:hypothetical protein SCRM01_028c [Synechococcus phage S-CRM01]AEC52975.1 hypothetical protein SCRM01_028c [Synechococcus phage S-CRM01]